MGEAKRRNSAGRRHPTSRSWALGRIEVSANDNPCFWWEGTAQDALDIEERYLATVRAHGWDATSYARRAAGYLLCYGMPKPGDPDLRPSCRGMRWDQTNVDTVRHAVLWLALHERIPDTREAVDEIVAGKALAVMFMGDKQLVLASTEREQAGLPAAPGHDFEMAIGINDDDYQLDPKRAVPITNRELFATAGKTSPPELAELLIYVPRAPLDAEEARAMLDMVTVTADLSGPFSPGTDPDSLVKTYAGYTEDELRRGRPGIRIE